MLHLVTSAYSLKGTGVADQADLWAKALAEAENPEARNPEIWARSFAAADGDESKAKAHYVKAKIALENPAPAMGYCPNCAEPVELGASSCECGADFIRGGWKPLTSRPDKVSYGVRKKQDPRLVKIAKNRGVYIVLALLLGCLGAHNFYAGRYAIGVIQLLITLFLGWFVVGFVITALWALIEIFVIKTDGDGDAMA